MQWVTHGDSERSYEAIYIAHVYSVVYILEPKEGGDINFWNRIFWLLNIYLDCFYFIALMQGILEASIDFDQQT